VPAMVGKLYSIDKRSITQTDTCEEIFEEKFIVKSCVIITI